MGIAVASVWIYEGLWCKIRAHAKDELRVVEAVPRYGERFGRPVLITLGWVELLLAGWVLSGSAPGSRHLIHDPVGMVFKNFAFLALCWVNAGLAR